MIDSASDLLKVTSPSLTSACCVYVLHRGGDGDDSGVLAKEAVKRQASVCSTLITFLKRSLKTKEEGGGGGGDSPSNGSPGMAVSHHAEVVGAVRQTQAAAMKGTALWFG